MDRRPGTSRTRAFALQGRLHPHVLHDQRQQAPGPAERAPGTQASWGSPSGRGPRQGGGEGGRKAVRALVTPDRPDEVVLAGDLTVSGLERKVAVWVQEEERGGGGRPSASSWANCWGRRAARPSWPSSGTDPCPGPRTAVRDEPFFVFRLCCLILSNVPALIVPTPLIPIPPSQLR
ncbi:hypothetical protein ACOMHN_021363 [Nucella lapillus]